jgi:hypothetical protein
VTYIINTLLMNTKDEKPQIETFENIMEKLTDHLMVETGSSFALLNNSFVFAEIINTRFYPEFNINNFLNVIISSFEKNRELVRDYLSNITTVGMDFEILHLTAHFSPDLLLNSKFRNEFDPIWKNLNKYKLTNLNPNQLAMLVRIADKLDYYNQELLAALEMQVENNLYQMHTEDLVGLLHVFAKWKWGSQS